MIHKRHPHVVTYLATYLAVALAIGFAIFFLDRAHQAALRRAAAAAEARKKAEPPPPPPVVKPEPPPPPPAPKPEPPVAKKTEPPPAPVPPSPDPMADVDGIVAGMHPLPAIRPLMEIVGNWKSVPQNAFPKLVMLKAPVTFEVLRAGVVAARGVIPAGSSVTPLALESENLRITPTLTSNIVAFVPVDQTDFKEKIESRYDSFVKTANSSITARRAQERERIIRSRKLDIELTKYGGGDDPRFDPMKASIRRGEAGFFQIETADRWRWAGKEAVEGVEYDVGYVMMVTESAFGSSEREIKALIMNGKVLKWLDAATNSAL